MKQKWVGNVWEGLYKSVDVHYLVTQSVMTNKTIISSWFVWNLKSKNENHLV